MSVPATCAAPWLRCSGLTVGYHGRPVVCNLDLDLPAGGLIGVTGANGAGKTTLLHGLVGLAPILAGTATLDGLPLPRHRHHLSLLSQRRPTGTVFPTDARGVVLQGRLRRRGWWRGFAEDDRLAVDQALTTMGIQSWAHQPFHQLSGGQAQRVLVARALASGTRTLLLDEPLAGLDPQATADLLARLKTWTEAGHLALVVLHDLAAAQRWCDRCLHLDPVAAPVAA